MEMLGRQPAGTAIACFHLQDLATRLGRGPDEPKPEAVVPVDFLTRMRHRELEYRGGR
jgi:hypothetical protein